MHHYNRVLRIVLTFLICLVSFPLFSGPSRNILIIHSYNQGYLWTDTVDSGIRRAFKAGGGNHELYSEYYDVKRFTPEEREEPFRRYLAGKYGPAEFAAVIVSDDNAFRFAVENRDRLFPGIPLVFCGLNNFDIYPGERIEGTAGIAEDFDVGANLRLIADIHGEGTLVAVVADSTTTGILNIGRFALAAEDESAPYLQYDILVDLDADELRRRLGMLPEGSVILNLGFFRDSRDRSFNHAESISLLTGTGFPVYTCWDHMIQYGTVGGIVIDGGIQGQQAAEYTRLILGGTPPQELPVHRSDLTQAIFDYPALKAHAIPMSRLPRDRVTRNLPNMIYYRYPRLFAFSLSVFAALLALVILLVLNILMRKQAEELFRGLFENAPDVILVHDQDGRILMINKAVERIHGYTIEEARQLRIQDLDTQEYAVSFPERLKEQFSDSGYECEVTHRAKDGRTLEFESSSVSVPYRGKEVILAILRDIGERNRSRRELENSAHEKELLLKEIHHRVKNNLQIIISLLRLQADSIGDQTSSQILMDSQTRVSAMAAVHEMLYQSDDLASIRARDYLKGLAGQLSGSYGGRNLSLHYTVEAQEIKLTIDQAIPVGIIVTELITNSLKYGSSQGSCRFRLELKSRAGSNVLRYRDWGPGFDYNNRAHETLGLELVDSLTKQLDGTLSHNGENEYTLVFPAD
jgi:PAS domain S-box-containing protein